MALRKQRLSLNMTNGVNTKVDERLSNSPTVMENVYIDKDAVLRKMNGFNLIENDVYENITTGDFIPSGEALQYPLDLISNRGDSAILDSKGLFGLNKNNNLVKISDVTSYGISNKARAILNGIQPYIISMAETSQAYHVFFQTIAASQISTYVIQKNGRTIDYIPLSKPAVPIVSSDSCYMMGRSTGTPTEFFLGLQSDDGNNPTSLGTIFDVGTTSQVQIDICEFGNNFICVSTGATDIFVAEITKTGTVVQSTSIAKSHIKESPISVSTDGTEISILYAATVASPNTETTARRLRLDNTLTETADTILIGYDDATICSTLNLSGIYHNGSFEYVATPSNPYKLSIQGNYELLASKLFVKNGEIFYYAIDYQAGNYGANTSPPIAGTFTAKPGVIEWGYKLVKYGVGDVGFVSEVIGVEPTMESTFALPVINMQLTEPTDGFAFMTGSTADEELNILNINEVNFTEREAEPFVEFGGSSLVSGLNNLVYDGKSLFKIAPKFFPTHYHYTVSAGSLTGTYDYVAAIAYFDDNGNIYRSRPSQKLSITLSSQIPDISYFIDSDVINYDGFRLELYQKLNTDIVYKKVGEAFSTSVGAEGGIKVAYQKDFGINLYTTGDVLENDAPNPSRATVFHNGRMVSINALRDNILEFSKKYVVGEGVQYSLFQSIVVEDNQGRRAEKIECLASLDSRLIIFKPNSILAIFGEGPDATGGNNDFSEPELVTTDVGCSNQRSIILTSKGVMFQSAKGIYLLNRSMGVEFIGAEVEAFTSPAVQADLMEDQNQVRFTLSDGNVLVYNYFFEKWTHWTLSGAVSSLLSDRGWQYLLTDGTMKVQDTTIFRDNGAFIKRKFNTGWIKLADVQGFQRVWRLMFIGEYIDDHQIKITAEYDYKTGGGDEYTITPGASLEYQYEVHLKRQKCQAVRFTIEDVDTGTTEEGSKISNVTIVAGIKQGLNKLEDASKN